MFTTHSNSHAYIYIHMYVYLFTYLQALIWQLMRAHIAAFLKKVKTQAKARRQKQRELKQNGSDSVAEPTAEAGSLEVPGTDSKGKGGHNRRKSVSMEGIDKDLDAMLISWANEVVLFEHQSNIYVLSIHR